MFMHVDPADDASLVNSRTHSDGGSATDSLRKLLACIKLILSTFEEILSVRDSSERRSERLETLKDLFSQYLEQRNKLKSFIDTSELPVQQHTEEEHSEARVQALRDEVNNMRQTLATTNAQMHSCIVELRSLLNNLNAWQSPEELPSKS